jgi:hypothetical protein
MTDIIIYEHDLQKTVFIYRAFYQNTNYCVVAKRKIHLLEMLPTK